MGFVRSWLLSAVALFALAGAAAAQTTNGTISGHVADILGGALPGVAVTATSPNLQGVRIAVTSENGDYLIPVLPPGAYEISFELATFETVRRTVTLASTQVLPIDARMGPAGVGEEIVVVGRRVNVLTQTTTLATSFDQGSIAMLPTNRDINAPLLMAPGVHPSGPNGAYSISGAASFESLFMVNGVTVNENTRGQPNTLFIEDAIQETTVATAGVSAEFGRFSGGMINVVTKSGGNLFSGSLRDSLANDNWRALTSLPGGAFIPNDRSRQYDRGCRRGFPVSRRCEIQPRGADVRIHVWRSRTQGSSLVLHGGPPSGSNREQADVRHEHPLHVHSEQEAIRGQRHLFRQLEPPRLRRVHEDPARSDQPKPAERHGPIESLRRKRAAGPVHVELQRRPVSDVVRRGSI